MCKVIQDQDLITDTDQLLSPQSTYYLLNYSLHSCSLSP